MQFAGALIHASSHPTFLHRLPGSRILRGWLGPRLSPPTHGVSFRSLHRSCPCDAPIRCAHSFSLRLSFSSTSFPMNEFSPLPLTHVSPRGFLLVAAIVF